MEILIVKMQLNQIKVKQNHLMTNKNENPIDLKVAYDDKSMHNT